MKNFIKTSDSETAKKLTNLGFQKIDDKMVFIHF